MGREQLQNCLNDNRCMFVRFFAFFVWALVAAAAVFWLLRLGVSAPTAPDHTVVVGESVARQSDLTRLLGAAAPAPVQGPTPVAPAAEASRFKLMGVMAPPAAQAHPVRGHGWALIAIDGKLPRTFTVGGAVDGDLVLQSVSLRRAAIGPSNGNPLVQLELPPLPQAATGSLSNVMNNDGGQPSSPAVPPPVISQPDADAFIPPPPAMQMVDPEGNPMPADAGQIPAAQPQPTPMPEGRLRSRIPPRGNSNLQQQRY